MVWLRKIFVAFIFSFCGLVNACPDALGYTVLKMAWPTPEYKNCDYKISPQGDGTYQVKIKSTGESTISWFSDKEVWIEMILTIDSQWNIVGLRWGDQKGFMPPGVANSILLQSMLSNSR